jgi:hypothetical protein
MNFAAESAFSADNAGSIRGGSFSAGFAARGRTRVICCCIAGEMFALPANHFMCSCSATRVEPE